MTTPLKNDQTALDPRLDRLADFDDASRAFPVRTLLPAAVKPRSYTWRCPVWLDQGRQGACVGFSWAHEIAGRPKPRPADETTAISIYRRAQQLDDWPGEEPAYSGTSVLAGAKAVMERGLLKSYRWCFGGVPDLVLAVGRMGPAVLGINWYEQMARTDAKGVIRADGELLGGHAILCNGVDVTRKMFRLHNSWGLSFGISGECFIGFDDMDRLLHESGEACVPIVR